MKKLMILGFIVLSGFTWDKDVKECMDNVAKASEKLMGTVDVSHMVSGLEDCQNKTFRIAAKAEA